MRTRQPATLDLRSILEAAHEAREEPEAKEVWEGFLLGAFDQGDHHARPERIEDWAWHASGLSDCTRAQAYLYAGEKKEPRRLESTLTTDIGHFYHALLQFGLAVHPRYVLIGHEIGGKYERLTGHADAVFAVDERDGPVVLIDIKSERGGGSRMRRKDALLRAIIEAAKLQGVHPSKIPDASVTPGPAVKPDHEVQTRAYVTLLDVKHGLEVDEAWICYVDKDSGEVDQQPVTLSGEDYANIAERIGELDQAGGAYHTLGILPPRLQPELKRDDRKRPPQWYEGAPWRCQPRSDNDGRGKWCPYRWKCMGDPE